MNKKIQEILLEISDFCKTCPSNSCCPEKECILYRIEKLLLDEEKELNSMQEYIDDLQGELEILEEKEREKLYENDE